MAYNIAVAGATGSVGRELLSILAERAFPVDRIVALASEASAGVEASFGEERTLRVEPLADCDFHDIDIALFSPGAEVSAVHAPRAAAAGAVVIDNTSQFRMEPDVPLVVPEVNPEAIDGYAARNIIANPNCSTIQMVVALKPLHDVAGVRRVVVSTYQSVSGAGRAGMDELFEQTRGVYANAPAQPDEFPKKIAFNVVPQVDRMLEDGSTREEWKMVVETQKILGSEIAVIASCVRVPVFVGHAEAVHVEFERPLAVEDARAALREAPGVVVVDHNIDGGYITPEESAGEDAVYVSRIRRDPTVENGLAMWVVSDNLRKGAALNTVQIAEALAERHLRRKKAA